MPTCFRLTRYMFKIKEEEKELKNNHTIRFLQPSHGPAFGAHWATNPPTHQMGTKCRALNRNHILETTSTWEHASRPPHAHMASHVTTNPRLLKRDVFHTYRP